MLVNISDKDPFEVQMKDLADNVEYLAGVAGGQDIPDGDIYKAAELIKLIPQLFAKVKHGKPGHEAWLAEAIECHFLGKPMPEYRAK